MIFAEKLFKLRKEHGLSQEALAEQLDTTRQAVSKWENNQGYPETEKLLLLSNLFEVSIDYLLKETADDSPDSERGYYVSREFALGYLSSERKQAHYLGLGFAFLSFALLPFLLFGSLGPVFIGFVVFCAVLGILCFVFGGFAADDSYRVLTREPLIFDPNVLKELRASRQTRKSRQFAPTVLGTLCVAISGVSFLLQGKFGVFAPSAFYNLVCMVLFGIGLYLLIRLLSGAEVDFILLQNEEYRRRFSVRLEKRLKSYFDKL